MLNKTILKADLDERIIGHVTAVDRAFNQFADNHRFTINTADNELYGVNPKNHVL